MADTSGGGRGRDRPRWRIVSIDDLKAQSRSAISIGPFGSRMKSDTYVESGVPVIRGKNISTDRSLVGEFVFVTETTADDLISSNVLPDDLVFPHRGAIGAVGLVPRSGPERWMLSTSLMKLSVDRTQADPLFLFYFFRSPAGRSELLKRSSNVGTPGIVQPLASLRSITLPLPPLPTQERIVDILGSIDDLIENHRRRVELLEEMARAIYREWFVHFRYPGYENDTFVDSPLGPLPDDWAVASAAEALKINPRLKLDKTVAHPFLTMGDLGERSMVCFPSGQKVGNAGAKFQNGDTLFARITPCLENGKTGFVQGLAAGAVGRGSTEFIVLRGAAVGPAFTYCLARSDDFRGHAISSMSGASGRQRVRIECFESFEIAVPPDDVSDRFEKDIGPLFEMVHKLSVQTAQLAAIRDLLLPKLVSGEIDVSSLDLDELVGAAVA